MGFLRESIAVLRSPELKELKRMADAQPRVGMLQGVRMAADGMAHAGALQAQFAGASAAYATGVAGHATVAAVRDTGMVVNHAPLVELDLDVTVPGRAPFRVTHRQLVAVAVLASFAPGSVHAVHLDPDEPSTLVLG